MTNFATYIGQFRKVRALFLEYMKGADNVRLFSEMPFVAQWGFVIRFLAKHNLSVAATNNDFAVTIIDSSKVREDYLNGFILLDLMYQNNDKIYACRYSSHDEPVNDYTQNLLTGLQEAIKYLDEHDF